MCRDGRHRNIDSVLLLNQRVSDGDQRVHPGYPSHNPDKREQARFTYKQGKDMPWARAHCPEDRHFTPPFL